jgi:hypothetical protein
VISSGIKILLDALESFYSNIINCRCSLSNNPYINKKAVEDKKDRFGVWLFKGSVYEFLRI